MFYIKVGDNSVVYTGDYNMTPDRHLGAAQIDRLCLDLLITESTYATTVRDSNNAHEREFLKVVHTCVVGGGKVLIPVFTLGRAQESRSRYLYRLQLTRVLRLLQRGVHWPPRSSISNIQQAEIASFHAFTSPG